MFKEEVTQYCPMCQEWAEKYNQLKAKAEDLEQQHQGDKGLITATGKMNYQLLQEYDKLKTEHEELKNFHINLVGVKECEIKELLKLKQTLVEIKPILEFYANSKMGEEQPDKTYKIMLSNGCIMTYDPKPARQALQKIRKATPDEN